MPYFDQTDVFEQQLKSGDCASPEAAWDALDLMMEGRAVRGGCSQTMAPASRESSFRTFKGFDGSQVVTQDVDGRCLVHSVVKDGERVEFSYDAAGQPFSIKFPDGSHLVKGTEGEVWYKNVPGKPDEYVPFKVERDKTYGDVVIKTPDGTIRYGKEGVEQTEHEHKIRHVSGDSTEHHKAGVFCDVEKVDGRDLVRKVSHAGQTVEISYDADGKPFSLKNPDGSHFVKGTEGDVWYLSRPGHPDRYVPFKIERNDADGDILIKMPRGITTLGRMGIVSKAR